MIIPQSTLYQLFRLIGLLSVGCLLSIEAVAQSNLTNDSIVSDTSSHRVEPKDSLNGAPSNIEITIPQSPGIASFVLPVPSELYLSRYLRFFDRNAQRDEFLNGDDEIITIEDGADSIYAQRLNELNTIVKLPYNPRVKRYMEVYAIQKRAQTRTMLALSNYYFPIFEAELERQGLPKELKYLAVVESALNPCAISPAGAAGLWQFMYRTGKMFSLRIDPIVDERLDCIKSTQAAVAYLKQLYASLNDWSLALAAYNCGPGKLSQAIRRAKGRKDFWEIYQFLPPETRNYVPAFVGAVYAMNYYADHGLQEVEDGFPELIDTVIVKRYLDFKHLSNVLNIPLQSLTDLNPQYRRAYIPASEEGLTLMLPVNYIAPFFMLSDSIFMNVESPVVTEENAQSASDVGERKVVYVVKRGDNLSVIASRLGVKIAEIREWNAIKGEMIHPGDLITVYTRKSDLRSAEAPARKPESQAVLAQVAETQTRPRSAPEAQQTTLQSLPTVQGAQDNSAANGKVRPETTPSTKTTAPQAANPSPKTPAASLEKAATTVNKPASTVNSTNTSKPRAPQSASKPAPKPEAKPQAKPTPQLRSETGNMRSNTVAVVKSRNNTESSGSKMEYYKVKKGETLYSIHRKYPGSSIQEIIQMNNLKYSGNRIYPDQILKIKIN